MTALFRAVLFKFTYKVYILFKFTYKVVGITFPVSYPFQRYDAHSTFY